MAHRRLVGYSSVLSSMISTFRAFRFWPAELSVLQLAIIQSAAVFVASVFWQQRWGTIVDTSWLITVCERMLSGDRLYVDILDSNPPFSFWFFMPAIMLSRFSGISAEPCILFYTDIVIVLGLGLAAVIIWRSGLVERRALLRQLPLFVALFTIFPGIAFTERDHLGTVLFLPLLALMAMRAGDRSAVPPPSAALIVATALCGSVLVLFKPYYIAACVLPALYVAWRRRSIWSLLAAENCIIALIGVGYIALVLWFCPEFVRDLLPKIADVYSASGDSVGVAVQYAPFLLLIFLLIWLVARGERVTPICAVTTLASLAAIGPLVYQGKGWAYHAFPAVALGLVAVLCRIAASPAWRYNYQTLVRFTLCLIVVLSAWRPFLFSQKPDENFVAAVRAVSGETPTLGMIGSDMAGAFPLSRMIDARFLSAYNSDWFGFLALNRSRQAGLQGNVTDALRYRKLSDSYLDEKYAEFATQNYDLIVVEDDQPPWTSHVFGQPRFAALMSTYHAVAKDARFTVFGRDSAGQTPKP